MDMTAQNPAISFPSNPQVGQEFLADNAITYTWTGDRWSATEAIVQGRAQYAIDGEYAGSPFIPDIDQILDGGGA